MVSWLNSYNSYSSDTQPCMIMAGLYRPTRENPLIGMLLGLPKVAEDGGEGTLVDDADAPNPKRRKTKGTPRSKTPKSRTKGGSQKRNGRTGSAGLSSAASSRRGMSLAPPSSPLDAKSTMPRRSLMASRNSRPSAAAMASGAEDDGAPPSETDVDRDDRPRRKRRTPSARGSSIEPGGTYIRWETVHAH